MRDDENGFSFVFAQNVGKPLCHAFLHIFPALSNIAALGFVEHFRRECAISVKLPAKRFRVRFFAVPPTAVNFAKSLIYFHLLSYCARNNVCGFPRSPHGGRVDDINSAAPHKFGCLLCLPPAFVSERKRIGAIVQKMQDVTLALPVAKQDDFGDRFSASFPKFIN